MTRSISGLSEIADAYDGILFDIYGVIHNGDAVFDAAQATLRALHEAGKPYAFLSNMPRRASEVSSALVRFGMAPELAKQAMTSGEAVYKVVQSGQYGRRYIFQGPERTRDIIAGLDLTEVTTPQEADFILVSGIGDNDTPADHQPLLDGALARNLPMLCANPDLKVRHGNRVVSCAGLLADAYERMGGPAVWIGKPHPLVFDMARDLLEGDNLLMVGDSLRTDITGAVNAGMDTLWITGGIDSATSPEVLLENSAVQPTAMLDRLVW